MNEYRHYFESNQSIQNRYCIRNQKSPISLEICKITNLIRFWMKFTNVFIRPLFNLLKATLLLFNIKIIKLCNDKISALKTMFNLKKSLQILNIA